MASARKKILARRDACDGGVGLVLHSPCADNGMGGEGVRGCNIP